jgi:hypothetical protein
MNERSRSTTRQPARTLSVDDQWIADWARRGLEELERYLALHAAFARYLERRDGRRRRD